MLKLLEGKLTIILTIKSIKYIFSALVRKSMIVAFPFDTCDIFRWLFRQMKLLILDISKVSRKFVFPGLDIMLWVFVIEIVESLRTDHFILLYMPYYPNFIINFIYVTHQPISYIIIKILIHYNYRSEMDDNNIKYVGQIIKTSYATLGYNSLQKRTKIMKQLLTQRQLPDEGLDQLTINYIMDELAIMDSNNFHDKIGVGERQSRIFSPIVQRRNFYMGHGIGRSGDVMANQPKAAGSSLLLQLTKFLTISAFKQLNYEFVKDVLLLPMATGMALTMVFLTLAQKFPNKKYVIWSRIDQKTCLKSIITANLIPIVVEQTLKDDSIACNHEEIQKKIQQIGVDKVLCIVSTTSCFAPRVPDDVSVNSLIAKKHGIYHVVNNAYGIWCTKIAHQIKLGIQKGQCTAVIQSMDKNFLVPVGGSIIFTQKQQLLTAVSSKYPGRASSSPIIDLFLTLLSMGKNNIDRLKKQRKQNFKYFMQSGQKFASKYGFRVLKTDGNTISIAMHLPNIQVDKITELGAILYSKRVMGHRILSETETKTKIGGLQFSNYGTHHEKYSHLPYITFACAVGTQRSEIQKFFERLSESIKQLIKKQKKKNKMNKTEITSIQKQQMQNIEMDIKLEEKEQKEQIKKSQECPIEITDQNIQI